MEASKAMKCEFCCGDKWDSVAANYLRCKSCDRVWDKTLTADGESAKLQEALANALSCIAWVQMSSGIAGDGNSDALAAHIENRAKTGKFYAWLENAIPDWRKFSGRVTK